MRNFMRKFESELKKCLLPVREASVCYSISLGLQTMQIMIFVKGDEPHGVILVNTHCADEDGKREISITGINHKDVFKERKKVNAEKIFKKVMEILKEDFHVEEKSRFRDESYWMTDKGVLAINRKQPNSL